jgi:iron complex transport system ATP-binding protein
MPGAFRVADLVALGLGRTPMAPQDGADIVARALAATGVANLADRPMARLSGGERARAHFARALAQIAAGRRAGQGRYLLLDEPTAALDIAHQVSVMRAARAAALDGAGVLVVLHDLNLAAAFADRAALLHDGRLSALGPPADVFTARGLSDVYGAPITVARGAAGVLRIAPDFAAADRSCAPPSTAPKIKDIPCTSP